jgi:hypothetical protein
MTTTTAPAHPADTGAGHPLTGAGIDAHADTLAALTAAVTRLDRNLLLVLRIVSVMADRYPPLAVAVKKAMRDE